MNRSPGLRPGSFFLRCDHRAGPEAGAPPRFIAPERIQSCRSSLPVRGAGGRTMGASALHPIR